MTDVRYLQVNLPRSGAAPVGLGALGETGEALSRPSASRLGSIGSDSLSASAEFDLISSQLH